MRIAQFVKSTKFIGMKTPTMRSMYLAANRETEKWCKVAFVLLVILTPICLVLPKALFIYFVYYTMDVSGDAFVLPYLIWLVVH